MEGGWGEVPSPVSSGFFPHSSLTATVAALDCQKGTASSLAFLSWLNELRLYILGSYNKTNKDSNN